MLNLLTAAQMCQADAHTLKTQQITSAALMERACEAFTAAFTSRYPGKEQAIAIVCGQGDNGADGLVIAKLLHQQEYAVKVYLLDSGKQGTANYSLNLKLLQHSGIPLVQVSQTDRLEGLQETLLIDAILGSGLNKPLTGLYAAAARVINAAALEVVAVDVPTGFPAEGELQPDALYLKASLVICFQRPKINFFFPESVAAMDKFIVVSIGLEEDFIQGYPSDFQLTDDHFIRHTLKTRRPFSHKGTYGHALIIAGQPETMGAALLASAACLHAGAGLTSAAIPESGLTALNTGLPEVMYLSREKLRELADFSKFAAVAIGPGLGTGTESRQLLEKLLEQKKPLIADADALNLMAREPELLHQLQPGSILTPHMKEFDQLFGEHRSWWARVETARRKAAEIKAVIVLKNQYTFIADPSGKLTVNPTGNPAMAQGGMGDTLTGIVASLSAQGYTPADAAILACYLHGKAGDELAVSKTVVKASLLADRLPETLKGLN